MDKMTVKLAEPVEVDGKTYESLTIGRFRAKHFKHMPKEMLDLEYDDPGKMSRRQNIEMAIAMMPLIAAMADVPTEVIEELTMGDLMEVVTRVGPFLAKSQSPDSGKS